MTGLNVICPRCRKRTSRFSSKAGTTYFCMTCWNKYMWKFSVHVQLKVLPVPYDDPSR